MDHAKRDHASLRAASVGDESGVPPVAGRVRVAGGFAVILAARSGAEGAWWAGAACRYCPRLDRSWPSKRLGAGALLVGIHRCCRVRVCQSPVLIRALAGGTLFLYPGVPLQEVAACEGDA